MACGNGAFASVGPVFGLAAMLAKRHPAQKGGEVEVKWCEKGHHEPTFVPNGAVYGPK